MSVATERRRTPRVQCPTSFQLNIEEYPELIGIVLNLSILGITFIFPQKLAKGSRINFSITCSNTPFCFDAPGEVLWSKQLESKDKYVYGAVFPYLDEDEVLQLREVTSLLSVGVKAERRQENRRKISNPVAVERRKGNRRKNR